MIGTRSGIQRGCGYREQGGAYLECGLDPDGDPVEAFLVDPPTEFEVEAHIGQQLVQRADGTIHILDWIGESHYPYPSDFIEEVRRHGMSRRISKNFDMTRLSKNSRVLCVHAKAIYEGTSMEDFHEHKSESRCGLFFQEQDDTHLQRPSMPCTRKWWWAAEPTEKGSVTRSIGDVVYDYVEGAEMPDPDPGIFASFPISNIAVIEAKDGSHEDTYEDIREDCDLPVIISKA